MKKISKIWIFISALLLVVVILSWLLLWYINIFPAYDNFKSNEKIYSNLVTYLKQNKIREFITPDKKNWTFCIKNKCTIDGHDMYDLMKNLNISYIDSRWIVIDNIWTIDESWFDVTLSLQKPFWTRRTSMYLYRNNWFISKYDWEKPIWDKDIVVYKKFNNNWIMFDYIN